MALSYSLSHYHSVGYWDKQYLCGLLHDCIENNFVAKSSWTTIGMELYFVAVMEHGMVTTGWFINNTGY